MEYRKYFSAGWQILEERVDDGNDGSIDEHRQYMWGLRYIDDIILHRVDANTDGDYSDSGDAVRYHLTNHQFSTVALIDDTAELLERVVYGAYGEDPQHSYPADLNRDGAVTSSELTTIDHLASMNVVIGDANYTPEADLDRDGDIDSTDSSMAQAIGIQRRLGSGEISDPAYGNTIGYTGHRYDPETQRYHMRNRVYVPVLGRFMQTDPAGYVDGLNLYGYTSNNPIGQVDPFGLDDEDGSGDNDDEIGKAIANALIGIINEWLKKVAEALGANSLQVTKLIVERLDGGNLRYVIVISGKKFKGTGLKKILERMVRELYGSKASKAPRVSRLLKHYLFIMKIIAIARSFAFGLDPDNFNDLLYEINQALNLNGEQAAQDILFALEKYWQEIAIEDTSKIAGFYSAIIAYMRGLGHYDQILNKDVRDRLREAIGAVQRSLEESCSN